MCATFIGSTFSQMPLPGERKSGIPDGVEIPAPVRATTESAERMRSARRRTSVRVAVKLLPAPLRRALAQERPDALARVLGLEHGGERLLLGLDALVEVAGGRDLLDVQVEVGGDDRDAVALRVRDDQRAGRRAQRDAVGRPLLDRVRVRVDAL